MNYLENEIMNIEKEIKLNKINKSSSEYDNQLLIKFLILSIPLLLLML